MCNARTEVKDRITSATSLVCCSHARPDGDALGSMIALARSARSAGRSAMICLYDPPPARYAFLLEQEDVLPLDQLNDQATRADLLVVMDTCSESQLEPALPALREHSEDVIVIDHHQTFDGIGSARWIDTTAAATGVLVQELLESLGWWIDPLTADALATATLTDTGWLRFENTDSRALRSVGRLVDAGARLDRLYQRIYRGDRRERLLLEARALGGLELHSGGRVGVLTLHERDFRESGAHPEETENLVNQALRVTGVEVAVLLVEQEGTIRVSLRSQDHVDVSAIAARFGGGGHVRAAGFRSQASLESVSQALLEVLEGAVYPPTDKTESGEAG